MGVFMRDPDHKSLKTFLYLYKVSVEGFSAGGAKL